MRQTTQTMEETSYNQYGHANNRVPHSGCAAGELPANDLVMLQEELSTGKDNYLRLAADFENYKKRTRRDAGLLAAAEKESFIHELLPVLDNLERALASEPATPSQPFREGVEMTRRQMSQLLRSNGIETVEDLGEIFDPERHDALSVRHDTSQPDHTVLELLQRGYSREGKVFRPAQVIVNDLSHFAES